MGSIRAITEGDVGTLQEVYDESSPPDIEVTSSQGPIHLNVGTGLLDTNPIFSIRDSSDVITSFITGEGSFFLAEDLDVQGGLINLQNSAGNDAILRIETDAKAQVELITYSSVAADFPIIRSERGRGTEASPSAVQAGDILHRSRFFGVGNTSGGLLEGARIGVEAIDTFSTATNTRGTKMLLAVTEAGASGAFINLLELNADEGALFTRNIRVGGSVAGSPAAGDIEWNGSNFRGHTGTQWRILDGVQKYTEDIGDGATNPITVNHSLGTEDVTVTIRRNSDDEIVFPTITVTDANNLSIAFGSTPSSNEFRVVVLG